MKELERKLEVVENRWRQAEAEKELEKEKYQEQIRKDFKSVRELIKEFADRNKEISATDANIANLQAILRKVDRILERNEI